MSVGTFEVVRWEAPPPPKHPGRARRPSSQHEQIAATLRERRGEWAVIYDGPANFGSGLSTQIQMGALPAYASAGDFEACSRLPSRGRRVVYARYLGDGDG